MKWTLWSLLWLFFQTPVADLNSARIVNRSGSPAVGGEKLKILTWNIDHGTRLDQITEALKTSGADICALQEVDWNAARSGQKDIAAELANRLEMSFSYGIEFQELSQGTAAYIGQATLSRWPVKAARILRFKRQSDFWQPHWWLPSSIPLMQRRLGSRIALVTEYDLGGRLLVAYNPHLESRSAGPIQMGQIDEMLADMSRYKADSIVVIAGDINSKYLPSAYLRKLERAGFRSALGDKIERSHVIMWALDWIFVRGPVAIHSGRVARELRGSDHYLVEGVLTGEEK